LETSICIVIKNTVEFGQSITHIVLLAYFSKNNSEVMDIPLTAKTPSLLNPLNAELNPICHLLALLGAHHILHVSRIRVKI